MSKRQRLYFRPDPDLAREEAVRQTVDAFLEFFIEQAEARGDHTAAAAPRPVTGNPIDRAMGLAMRRSMG